VACRLIDDHKYTRREKRAEIPKEPLCMSAEEYKAMNIKIAAVIVIMLIAAVPVLIMTADQCKGSPFQKESAERMTYRVYTDKLPISLPLIASWAALIGIPYFIAKKIKIAAYANLQNPMKNPRGFKYQGRLLKKQDPHYLLHLSYYQTNGTWVLPDEIEHSADYVRPEEPSSANTSDV